MPEPLASGVGGLTRRGLLTLGGRTLAAGVVGGLAIEGGRRALDPGGATAAADSGPLGRPLRIGHLPITDAAALLVAHEEGHFAVAGVPAEQPVLFRTWEALAQAFLVGEVDVVHLLMPLALQMRFARRAPIRVVAWGHTNGSALTVAPTVTRLSDLANRTVAVPQWWSIHNVLLQQTLAKERIGVSVPGGPRRTGDVNLVVMPPAEMVSALASHQIAGFTVAEPFCTVAAKNGFGRTFRYLGDVWRQHACCAVVVRDELVTRTPDAAAAIVRGVMDAQAHIEADRAGAAGVLTGGGYLPQPPPAVATVLERSRSDALVTRHEPWHGERLDFPAYPRPTYTDALVDLLRRTRIDGDTAFLRGLDGVHEELIEPRFVVEELRRRGQTVPDLREEIAA